LLHKIAHRDPALQSAAIFYGNNFVALYRTHPIPDNKIVPVKMAPFFQCQTGYLAAQFFYILWSTLLDQATTISPCCHSMQHTTSNARKYDTLNYPF